MTASLLPYAIPREISNSRTTGVLVPAPVRLKARMRIGELLHQASKALGMPVPDVSCSFDLRGTTAGQALMTWRGRALVFMSVRLNGKMLLENEGEFMSDVIPHELAHLLTALRHGPSCKPHGREWQSMMRALGVEPNRTHAMEAAPARQVQAKYRYVCACKEFLFTSIRHKRAQKPGTSYNCKRCGQALRYAPGGQQAPRRLSAPPPQPAAAPAQRAWTQPAVAPRPASPPVPSAVKHPPVVLAPTEKQLAYALALAQRHQKTIPPTVRFNRALLSDWIAQHA